jgi:hypothetical protein
MTVESARRYEIPSEGSYGHIGGKWFVEIDG